MTKKKILKIGNAGGYWGDDPTALERQVMGGRLDYISMDFLAEITMSILQKKRSSDPQAGYAKDFLPMLSKVFKKVLADKTCIITNAGGVNPEACARDIAAMATSLGLKAKIAIVYGDDILQEVGSLEKQGCKFTNMETGETFAPVRDKLQSANVYFGALPVVEALRKWQPDIIVTGRVTDTGITLAPMIYEFGWDLKDWDKLAAGIIAGHMIECGTQVSGGNFTDWHLVKSFHNVGFPIVEVNEDGSFVLTKHSGSGGLVTYDTVREQVFYEMGNPKAYITPDVVADFTSIKLEQAGKDRVKVSGIKGFEPTEFYKVSMAYEDGYKAVGSIVISGPNAQAKAKTFADIFWQRTGKNFSNTETEFFGWNGCHKSLIHHEGTNEILLRLGATSESKEDLAAFGKIVPALILSGPPGVAVTGGVPKVQSVISYWPALIPKQLVQPKIALFDNGVAQATTVTTSQVGHFNSDAVTHKIQTADASTQTVAQALKERSHPESSPLYTICLGRSGDKGDTCNIGVLARGREAFLFLEKNLTAQVVKNLFQDLCFGKVTRYTLDDLMGFNFLLESSLGGGGTMTMRSDAQGKTFAQGLLSQRMLIPKDILASAKAYDENAKNL